MKKKFSLKKLSYEDYDYLPYNNNFKYYKYSEKPIKSKNNNFNNEITQLSKNELILENNIEEDLSTNNINIEDLKSFYPKNYKKEEETQLIDIYNDNLSNEKKNNENNNNKNSNSYNNYKKNKNEIQLSNEEISLNKEKNQIIEKENVSNEYKKDKKVNSEKPKKFYVKSIPHPKRKKCQETFYIPRKKLFNFQQKKEAQNYPLSLISNQNNNNNYDSSKNSVSTLNTSSSSYKEKVRINDENNLNINQNIEFNYGNILKKNINNKFEGILIKNNNNNLENTEILNVNIKLSNDKIIIFKLRRFDDLFLTIKFFCEINSIDVKFIKPLITKLLCTLNTIYQIINSEISSEAITILKQIKNEMK